MSTLRTSVALALLGMATSAVASAQQFSIDFDSMPGGAIVSGQEPSAIFSASTGYELQTFGLNLGTSLPNYVCTAPQGSSITCKDPVYVDFPTPVEDLLFFAVGTNKSSRVATARVFVNGALAGTHDIQGSGKPKVPVLVDLSAYQDVTRLELIDIDDFQGIGWDDFSFTVDPAPGFDPPTPCTQVVVGDVKQPMTFTVDVSDALGNDTVTLDVTGLPPGANFTPALPMTGNPLNTQFTWTPGPFDVGTHVLVFTAVDTAGQTATCTISVEVNCTGNDLHYGAGLAGSGNIVPTLSVGCALVSEQVIVDVDQALGGTIGCMFFGEVKTSYPVFGGTLLAVPLVVETHVVQGTPGQPGAGSKSFTFSIPNDPTLSGRSIYLQSGYIDPGAPFGVSLTDGLEVVIGD